MIILVALTFGAPNHKGNLAFLNTPTGQRDSSWLAEFTRYKAPKQWKGGVRNGQISGYSSTWHHVYAVRKGPPRPHRLMMDIMFFTNPREYFRWNSKVKTILLLPFIVISRGSSVLHIDYFNAKFRHSVRPEVHALHWSAPYWYNKTEPMFRMFLCFLFMPFVVLLYITPIHYLLEQRRKHTLG